MTEIGGHKLATTTNTIAVFNTKHEVTPAIKEAEMVRSEKTSAPKTWEDRPRDKSSKHKKDAHEHY